jgi:DNA-binding response OmpR family regulator
MASILVVDGDPDLRRQHEVDLEMDGHRVTSVAGEDGVLTAVAASAPELPGLPELIVLDIGGEASNGLMMLERLKADDDPDVAQIPVLVASSLGSEADQLRGFMAGAVRYLIKPVSSAQLRDAVIDVLSDGAEIDQRRRAQAGALERLVRSETGHEPEVVPRVHLTRLERADLVASNTPVPAVHDIDFAGLTSKQLTLLDALRQSPSVSSAASMLGVSRSSVYASLRRISRKLDVGSVQTLLHLLRTDRPLSDP